MQMQPSIIKAETSASRTSIAPSGFTLKKLSVVCWVLFAAFLAAPIAIVMKDKIQSGRLRQEERDFVFFYGMGRMLNQYPPSQLYNLELQKKVATDVFPLKAGRQYTPNPYPPFVALLFRPFALLPFSTAYPLWLSVSFSLYVFGLALAASSFFPNDFHARSLIFCMAFLFLPFWWIMMGGQIPVIGFIGFSAAFRAENRERPLASGLALSLCLYKPTLLVLILPMLLVTRRFKVLTGFIGGGLALCALTTVVEGVGIWSGYLRMLLSFGTAATKTDGYRVLHYYMDLPAFSSLLPGGRSWLGGAILLGFACYAAFGLFRAWWKHRDATKPARILLWAATLTWTFVLNLYVPIYDSIIVVIGIIATAATLNVYPETCLRRQFTIIWILILVASWVTGPVAEATGFQMYTFLFALLGIVQLTALRKVAAVESLTIGLRG